MKRVARVALVVVTVLAGLAIIPAFRHRVLTMAGAALLLDESGEPGDVVVLSESGDPTEFLAVEIEAADMYARRDFPRVFLVRAAPTPIDDELTRRGVRLEDPVVSTLRQLGVPSERITMLDAGEGGTTESTAALAAWIGKHPARMLVIIGAAHSRRYHRALLRAWPAGAPPPRVTYPRRTLFRVENWWTSRRTLREGLFELQKLAWDYASHPF